MPSDLRTLVLDDLRLHPRVAYQGLFTDPVLHQKMVDGLPPLPVFRNEYVGAISVVDWDHRLPSQTLTLRLFGYYSESSLEAGAEAFDDRLEEIGLVDRYPEFDVPDFDQIAADEAYEIEISLEAQVQRCRLTSAWRRELSRKEAKVAVETARKSSQFVLLQQALNEERPAVLGDLEAVSWTPPCESEHSAWTIDVWYLLAFDGRVGAGRSFLVDIEDQSVISSRDFSVRAG